MAIQDYSFFCLSHWLDPRENLQETMGSLPSCPLATKATHLGPVHRMRLAMRCQLRLLAAWRWWKSPLINAWVLHGGFGRHLRIFYPSTGENGSCQLKWHYKANYNLGNPMPQTIPKSSPFIYIYIIIYIYIYLCVCVYVFIFICVPPTVWPHWGSLTVTVKVRPGV